MISLLFFSLVAAFAEGPGRLRGTLVPGPADGVLIHRESGKHVTLRSFEDRVPLVCDWMLKGGESASAYGLETSTGLSVDAKFAPPTYSPLKPFHGWVRTQVGPFKYSLFPHSEVVDTIDALLEAPVDLGQLGALRLSGLLARHIEALMNGARALEGPSARGARTFAAHGKFDAEGEFALEAASVLVKNVLPERVPFLTIVRGLILVSPRETKLATRTARWLKIVPGPELGEVDLPGEPARLEDLRGFNNMTLMGLQVGGELHLLRVLRD